MKRIAFGFLVLLILSIGYFSLSSHRTLTKNSSTLQRVSATVNPTKRKPMKLLSTAFADHATIPVKYTCDGPGINPPLTFADVPSDAQSLVLLVDDPDIPSGGVFDHWVIYNISPEVSTIDENSTPSGTEGLNGTGQPQYYPMCPPDREHRYFFKLFALDSQLDFQTTEKVTKEMVIDKMQGHIIEEAELVGLYNRQQNK